jgi:hypothetical protein
MALRLPTNSKNTRRFERDSNTELVATPHRCGAVMVRQARERSNWRWDELKRQFTSNFNSTYKRPASTEEVKACTQKSTTNHFSHTYNDGASSRTP